MGSPSKKAPSGPFSDKLWRDALRLAVSEKDKATGQKKLRLLATKMVDAGIAGDVSAAREIGNRLDGMPAQTSDVTIRDERMVVNAPPPAKDADEWAGKHGPH